MVKAVKLIVILIFSFVNNDVQAQSLTGSWEGRMGSEILQINIEQKNGALCGYTYDIEMYDRTSFCSVKFTGTYLFDERKWYLQGYEFITHSPKHVFMNIKIWFDPADPLGALRASVNSNDVSLRMHDYFADEVLLRRKSSRPIPYEGQKGSCFDKIPEKPNPERDNIPETPKKEKPPIAPNMEIPKKPESPIIDSVKIISPNKVITTDSAVEKIKKMEARKNSEQSRLVIHSKTIKFKIIR